MGYNSHAYANIKNNTPLTLKSVSLFHQYSDDPDQGKTWSNVAPGVTTDSFEVGFNTGFIRTGQDYWWGQYTLPDDSVWVSPGTLVETLHSGDKGTTKTFVIDGSRLVAWNGNSMTLNKRSLPEYNTWAVVVLKNDFPVNASVTLSHKYSTDRSYEHTFPVVAPGQTCSASDGFIVYYNTGFIRTGSDHWSISVKLDIPPYDNSPDKAFAPFSNSDSDKGCMLKSSDNGKLQTFTIDGKNFTMGVKSGSCTDHWKTWNGYNTLAFLEIENKFTQTIASVTLTHEYSGDATWRQTRGLISKDGESPLMVAEYNTGFIRTGSDYWNVYVYLEDGTWYQNYTNNKGCMLESADATVVTTFTVSSARFGLGLASGSCSDSMTNKGQFLPSAGRDVNQPYDKNAFIGSHNAYANFANGFWYAQQSGSLDTQMGLGATTLLLDIWYDDGDIYLKHEDFGILQPFVVNEKLSSALAKVRAFLELQSRDPVTIVFEDRVDAAHQSLIKQAFIDSDTWDMVFNADSYNVNVNGWPTLAELFKRLTPLVVFTSNSRSPDFAYQWAYMSENVYGDASLDKSTWLDPRSNSQPLDKLALCALNHFPTWSVSDLTTWIQRAKVDNATALLKTLIDDCQAKWGRLPNYINADFWEIPENGVIDAVYYMNQKLQGKPVPSVKSQVKRTVLVEIDDSQSLAGNWKLETQWIEAHWDKLCPAPSSLDGRPLVDHLEDLVNLSLILSTLQASSGICENPKNTCVPKMLRRVARYLMSLETEVLRALEAGDHIDDKLCTIPYFLIESKMGMDFEITELVRKSNAKAGATAGHDGLLLAGLAGNPKAIARLENLLAASEEELAQSETSANRTYDLTHEMIYLVQLTGPFKGSPQLLSGLARLIEEFMPRNRDLGAELLACYWIAGGTVTVPIRQAVRCLKAYSDEDAAEIDKDDKEHCSCERFKEQVHQRLTMLLGLGTTLAIVGDIIQECEPL